MRTTFTALAGLLVTLALTQSLDKPPLESNLDYLQKGLLEYLQPVNNSYQKWDPAWIPADCKSLTENNNLSASDVEAFSVWYADCRNDPWILCRYKASPDPLRNMIDLFGRVPVGARQWVRHVINLPDRGNLVMMDRINGDLTVFIHETGHSLDLLGAYPQKPLSSSKLWPKQYAKDSHVPDPYSRSNLVEDLAQNTVVAALDLNVKDGFGTVEPKWRELFHQYNTIENEQRKAGNLLVRGGVCTGRLQNSKVVKVKGNKTVRARGMREPPRVELSDDMDVIEPVEFDTRQGCKLGH